MIGDIHFYSGTGLFSNLIKFFTRSQYTHVAIEVGEILNEKIVFESYLDQQMSLKGNPLSSFRIPVEVNQDALKDLILKFNKKDYGWLQLLWFVYRWFLELFGIKEMYSWKNWFPNHNICSEMGIRFLNSQEFLDLKKYNPNSVHPADLYKICLNSCEKL